MNSSLVKLLTVVLAWPALAITIIMAYEWYRDANYVHVEEPLGQERVQHPTYFRFAQEALDRYSQLSKSDQQDLVDDLRKLIIPMSTWMEHLNRSDVSFICLGETHDDHNRRFLAESFFPAYDLEALFLETTAYGLQQILEDTQAGEPYALLLGADMGRILQSVMARNPHARILGIEETDQQRSDRQYLGNVTRSDSIFKNLIAAYNKNSRTVVLYGALHCNQMPNRLYERMRQSFADVSIQNVLVQGAHQDGLMESLVYFLDEIGILHGDFVITDTQGLPPWVRENFVWLWAQTLDHYESVIVYKPLLKKKPASKGR